MSDFVIIEGDATLRDVDGNLIGVVSDGQVYRLQTQTQLTDGASRIEEIFEFMLRELRAIRQHLECVTDLEMEGSQ